MRISPIVLPHRKGPREERGGAHPILRLVTELGEANGPASGAPTRPSPRKRLALPEPARAADKVVLGPCRAGDVVERVARGPGRGQERLGGEERERGGEGVGEEDVGGRGRREGERGFALRRRGEGDEEVL